MATPFVGYHSDSDDDFWICKYGRRKAWHLIGSICTLLAFPFIFGTCVGCETSDKWAQLVYYASFVVIFQFGWAAVQISHLSLIPELTPNDHERTQLTALRYKDFFQWLFNFDTIPVHIDYLPVPAGNLHLYFVK